jgi:hypothetical protein
VIKQEAFDQLFPLALAWAKAQEEFVLARGFPLEPSAHGDALRAGVQDPGRVRVLVVDRIPLPENAELTAASQRGGIITAASRAVAIGHAIIVRADCWRDRELLVHQLVHVAQCERSGGLEPYVRLYLQDRQSSADFTAGTLEEEARRRAREICAK